MNYGLTLSPRETCYTALRLFGELELHTRTLRVAYAHGAAGF